MGQGCGGNSCVFLLAQGAQYAPPQGAAGGKSGAPRAGGFAVNGNVQCQVSGGQQTSGVLRPFGQLQAGGGKGVAQAGVFPFARVFKAVEVKVRYWQLTWCSVALNNGVAGAFDGSGDAECAQQAARKGGFAHAQTARECDEGAAHLWQRGQSLGKVRTRQFLCPVQHQRRQGGGFYNFFVNSGQLDTQQLWEQMQHWARELGFAQLGVADVDLSGAEPGLRAWLAAGFHGQMNYMAAHGMKRARPAELVPGTVSVVTARMNYLPRSTPDGWQALEWARRQRPTEGVVSLYARGRDYHKVVRSRLQKLQERVAAAIGPFGHRVFSDSAPVLEAELAARSGQGWRGRHTLLLSRTGGSIFFLGELFMDVHLPRTAAPEGRSGHCGSCTACLAVCPTGAIVAPHRLDARRCISYLTIRHDGPIDEALRPLIGNRIYGCDDCQLACPWNKFARCSNLADFDVRQGMEGADLVDLFSWEESEFLQRTNGSPIRRIGHVRWLRNIAVALGNALSKLPEGNTRRAPLVAALQKRAQHTSEVVREHVQWALRQCTKTPGRRSFNQGD